MDESLPGARVHGGTDDPRLVDFSVNLNPYGPCAPVLAAARAAELARYPDATAREARQAWAAELGCEAAELAVGHGAADLLWAIARAFLRPGACAVIAEPTFSEFRVAAAACGADVLRVGDSLALDLEALPAAEALYLCSPNNPTGEYLAPERIARLAERLANTAIVLDESFLGLSDHALDERVELPPNVLRVRSLTKEFACPGLRIGLCRAQPAWIARIERQRPTWATSSPALAALAASAHEPTFVRESFARMRRDREAVRALFVERGYRVHPSAASYQLVEVGQASPWVAALRAQGVLVRDCSSFGLPAHVRVAALPGPARSALAAALDAVSNA
jgi:histidinol-phosphate/aromatic aminotransferase/cobyric acid decarboxylase-like protein